jgi:hypothetical protein
MSSMSPVCVLDVPGQYPPAKSRGGEKGNKANSQDGAEEPVEPRNLLD